MVVPCGGTVWCPCVVRLYGVVDDFSVWDVDASSKVRGSSKKARREEWSCYCCMVVLCGVVDDFVYMRRGCKFEGQGFLEKGKEGGVVVCVCCSNLAGWLAAGTLWHNRSNVRL